MLGQALGNTVKFSCAKHARTEKQDKIAARRGVENTVKFSYAKRARTVKDNSIAARRGVGKHSKVFTREARSTNGQEEYMRIYAQQARGPEQTQQALNKVDSQNYITCAWKKIVSSELHNFKDAQFHTAAEIKEYTRSPEYKTAMDKRREKRAAKYKANSAAAAAEDSDGSTSE